MWWCDRVNLRWLLIAALCASTAACGFKLRGQQTFPFDTINVPLNTPLGAELRRNIAAASAQTKVVDSPTEAEAVLTILSEAQEKVILSLSTQGRVQEYQLRLRVAFRVSNQKGLDFIPATAILLTRDITFNDQVLAKEVEEAQLYREMRSDLVQQILRRLGAAKAITAEDDE
jgi:LPS-assembly lipoprotein